MIDSTETTSILDSSAKIAGIITLIVAIGTYWFNWIHKKNLISKTRKYLNIELRTLYFNALTPDIFEYDRIVNSHYKPDISFKAYDNPIMTSIIKSESLFRLFKKSDSVNIINMTYNLIKKAEMYYHDYVNHAPKTIENKKRFLDFYFKHRIVEIRERIIELSENEDFIDLKVMPKNYEGHLTEIDRLDSKTLFSLENERIIQNMINNQILNKTEKLIEKYRYIQKQDIRSYGILKKYLGEQLFRIIPEQYFGEE